MGPPGVLLENQTPKDTAEPHHQIRAIPAPGGSLATGQGAGGWRGWCGVVPRCIRDGEAGALPATCGQRVQPSPRQGCAPGEGQGDRAGQRNDARNAPGCVAVLGPHDGMDQMAVARGAG